MRLFSAVLFAAAAFAASPQVIPLYQGPAPGSESWNWQRQEIIGPQDNVRRIYNVTRPQMTAYIPAAPFTGTAVIVVPGGGFRYLAIDYEGHDCARWLNSIGVAAFVLEYRVVRTGDEGEKDPAIVAARQKESRAFAIADGQRAVSLVRSRAAEWGIAPDRIGIMGFSAGGYVTAGVAVQHDAGSRPNFAAPVYGAMPDDLTPPADAPPLFLIHADDDNMVPTVSTSIRMYEAWKKAKLPAEIHIYAAGGHGFGMRTPDLPVATWRDRFRDWLGAQGLLKPAR